MQTMQKEMNNIKEFDWASLVICDHIQTYRGINKKINKNKTLKNYS